MIQYALSAKPLLGQCKLYLAKLTQYHYRRAQLSAALAILPLGWSSF